MQNQIKNSFSYPAFKNDWTNFFFEDNILEMVWFLLYAYFVQEIHFRGPTDYSNL